jgi:hypothetical protein
MYLKRPEREVKPWYTDKELKRAEERETDEKAEERRARDRYVQVHHSLVSSIKPSGNANIL